MEKFIEMLGGADLSLIVNIWDEALAKYNDRIL